MYSISSIFPTVLYADSYNGNLFDEYMFCRQLETITLPEGSMVSINKNVLDAPELSKVKSCLQHALNVYTKEVMNYDCDVYITQSWVSTQPKGTSLYAHSHPNSFVSGVIYFTNEGDTPIVFEGKKESIQPTIKQFTPLNSRTWRVSGKKGGFILFPSSLDHRVERNDHDMDRVSLAFNTFVRGKLGNEDKLNLLEL